MQISYTIEYSNRKTLSIIVERDRTVLVRAPHNTEPEVIEREIQKRKFLLFKKIHHPQKYNLPREKKEFVSGESLMYLGTFYKLEIVNEPIHGIEFDNKFVIGKDNQSNAESLFRDWYIRQAEITIIPRAEYYANSLGVKYNQIKVLDLKYRWGSCTPKDNVNFNWRIVKAAPYVVDYILVHELTHLLELNHSPEFWNIVSVQLPHFEKAKAWLKENGGELEIDF